MRGNIYESEFLIPNCCLNQPFFDLFVDRVFSVLDVREGDVKQQVDIVNFIS